MTTGIVGTLGGCAFLSSANPQARRAQPTESADPVGKPVEPRDLTIASASRRLRRRELSSLDLVESCLARIDEHDEQIEAWTFVDRDGARATARRCDEEIRQGKWRGPLHGVPIGIKENFRVAGVPGRESRVEDEATCVTRLKEAGAVILGLTFSTDFVTSKPAPTRNPWNTEHTPGGSSAGSGAAVAARMCLAALGTQSGGSVLRPAAYNGVVGLKTRHGRISLHGVSTVSLLLGHIGVLARSVKDTAIVLQLVAGHDPHDPLSLGGSVPDYLAAVNGSSRAPRIGLARKYFYDLADEEMRRHSDAVADRLRHAGATVEEIELPESFAWAQSTTMAILMVEMAASHEERFATRKDAYGADIARIIERGSEMSATEYTRVLRARLQLMADLAPVIDRYDLLMTPGATGPAPRDLTTTGDASIQIPWSLVGYPALSIPSGLSETGMPLAVQLVGAPDREPQWLSFVQWCERTLDFRSVPPICA